MRGFFLGALVLVGLDVVLRAPGTRVAQALALPAAWLAKWTDPRTPLIGGAATSSASSSSSTSTSGQSLRLTSGEESALVRLLQSTQPGIELAQRLFPVPAP